ncbi:MAG: N-acetylgalactosamine-6-sulfatase, partial [Bacteroidetes bacterium]|nr:N-acetylgalactosamine-6-sulfatase [Bacteroidota bacterium]
DVMPTFCELAGLPKPMQSDGISFLPTLLGKQQDQTHEYLYWEFPAYKGQQALRMGKWKAIRRDILEGNLEIELYDLEADIQEGNNVADENPGIIAKVEEIFRNEHRPAAIERFRMAGLGD